MKEVDQFFQKRAFTFAHGCIKANSEHANEKLVPSFSWDSVAAPGDRDIETILGSNITWTHFQFSNKSHLDKDNSPFAYFMSAPTFSKDGRLAKKADNYDVVGGEFLFPSLKYLIDLNSQDGVVA